MERIGTGNAAGQLKYNLETVTAVAGALKRTLRVQVLVRQIDTAKPMTLLTQAKTTKLAVLICQLFLQYVLYYKYVDKNRETMTEEEVLALQQEAAHEVSQIQSTRGVKKIISKLFASFHAALINKGGKGSKLPRAKRAPKKAAVV